MKKIGLLFLLAIVFACAPKVNLIDSTGKQLPTLSYEMRDLAGRFFTTFYYVELETSKDLDGTQRLDSKASLPIYREHRLKDETDFIRVHIEIWNPEKIEYSLKETSKTIRIDNDKFKETSEERNMFEIARSDKEYREFDFILSTKDIKRVEYELNLFDGKESVLTFGKLKCYTQQ